LGAVGEQCAEDCGEEECVADDGCEHFFTGGRRGILSEAGAGHDEIVRQCPNENADEYQTEKGNKKRTHAMDTRKEDQNTSGDFREGNRKREGTHPRSRNKGKWDEGEGKLFAGTGFDNA